MIGYQKDLILKANPAYLLESLSNLDVTFFIPPYQRNYEWGISTCRVFLNDVQKVADSNGRGVPAEHFFGSLVYVVEESGFGTPAKYVLTDGQQRITTTMLFLMALRDSLEDGDYADQIQKRYIENERSGPGSEYKIKLKQVETDWEAYRLLALRLEVSAPNRSTSVFENYQFFSRAVANLSEQSKKDLLEQGLARFSTIAIQLEPDRNSWENPQEIFESMNSLGKPLSLADLVRNFLLMGRGAEEQTLLYNKYWLALENRLPGLLSEFIRDWMQADRHESLKVAKENNYKELYGDFKTTVTERKGDQAFLELSRFSSSYAQARGLENTNNSRIEQALADLRVIGANPAMSFIAEIIEAGEAQKLTAQAVEDILLSLRTYLLRRRIVGLTTAENQFFPVLGSKIDLLARSSNPVSAIFAILTSGYFALRLPNDDELGSRLKGMNFYNLGRSKNYPKLLLSLAEEHLTKARPAWDDPNLQLEHILPQTLSEEWRRDLGQDADALHQELVNTVGNLTLIRHNQELGNSPFTAKKEAYQGKSGMQITQNHIVSQSTWDAEAIRSRTNYLTDLLVNKVLSIPSDLRYASNWNTHDGDEGFNIREVLNQLIGETIRFVDDPRVTALVISGSKVLFEGSEWALSPLTSELKKRRGSVSKHSNFSGGPNWTWDDTRLTDVAF